MNLPPVIIIGMHRSGTSLIVSMLKEAGFFAGEKTTRYQESTFFNTVNEWVMRGAGGAWDYPLQTSALIQDGALRLKAVDALRRFVGSRYFFRYSGSMRQLIFNAVPVLERPWGWKDPRNTFTVKLWLEVFDGARVLYVKRNGVDVANSLYTRESAALSRGGNTLETKPIMSRLRSALKPVDAAVSNSIRCGSFTECFRLWEEYTNEAEDFFDGFSGEKLGLRFEDFVLNPDHRFREVLEFCGLDPEGPGVSRAMSMPSADRAYAFVKDEHLCRFYDGVKDTVLMKRLGYQGIGR